MPPSRVPLLPCLIFRDESDQGWQQCSCSTSALCLPQSIENTHYHDTSSTICEQSQLDVLDHVKATPPSGKNRAGFDPAQKRIKCIGGVRTRRQRRQRPVSALWAATVATSGAAATRWALGILFFYSVFLDSHISLFPGALCRPIRFLAAAGNYDDDLTAYYEQQANGNGDDDNSGEIDIVEQIGFGGVSVMPVSCFTYGNGHMIKFQLFENNNSYQCHFKNLGTFVVSIAHFMRAYFNYVAMTKGQDFSLPQDASYLNCVMIQETQYSDQKLYAKVGCMDRETFTSTKLQLHVFTDKQCTQSYDDGSNGSNERRRGGGGYDINGQWFSNKVSFRPPFYSCIKCSPDQISDTFQKNRNWYDDDYINNHGGKKKYYNDDANAQGDDGGGGGGNDDGNAAGDDAANDAAYYDDVDGQNDDNGGNGGNVDDAYYNAINDDINYDWGGGNDDNAAAAANDDNAAVADDGGGNNDDKVYDDDYYNRRLSAVGSGKMLTPADGVIQQFENKFWAEIRQIRRSLEDANYYNKNYIGDWNFCQRLHKYGMWCDEDCRALDTFRTDEWSNSDIFLLVIMCVFMAAMMLLVFAKRVKAYEKASIYGDEGLDGSGKPYYPGLPPMAMVLVFLCLMAIIIVLAKLKLVNETLVFAVITCILLFIYMLKLTLFESRGPRLLPAAHPPGSPTIPFESMNNREFL